MSTGAAAPDREAELYDEHWQPVLAPAVGWLLDRAEAHLGPLVGQPHRRPLVVDVGTGTAALLVAAATRWAGARFVGLDASQSMLARARLRARQAGLPDDEDVLRWIAATAESMPLEDDVADRVISSFALQLVQDRGAVLREVRRILRPGGCLAFVTWMAQDTRIEPDDEFDEAVLELGIAEPEPEQRPASAGDFESAAQADLELRDAGFESPRVDDDVLTHAWSRRSFLTFKEAYDERELFDSLDEATRRELVTRVRRRWAALPDEAFVLRAPLVTGLARRP